MDSCSTSKMKCFIILSLLALAYCLPTVGKNVSIGEDGTITITEVNGKRIVISKGVDHIGNKHIEISVDGPFMPTKKIKIMDETYPAKEDVTAEYVREKRSNRKTTSSSSEILMEIFKELEGPMDEKSYEKLLKKLRKEVEAGLVHPEILAVVEQLEEKNSPVSWEDQYVSPADIFAQKQLYNMLWQKFAGLGKSAESAEQKNVLEENLKELLRQKVVRESQYGNGVYNWQEQPSAAPAWFRYPEVYGEVYPREFVGDYASQVYGSPLNWRQALLRQLYIQNLEKQDNEEKLIQKYANEAPVATQKPWEVPVATQKPWGVPVATQKPWGVPVATQKPWGAQSSWPVSKNAPVYQQNVAEVYPYKVHPFVGSYASWPVVEGRVPMYQWNVDNVPTSEEQYRWSVVGNRMPVYHGDVEEQSRWPVSEEGLPFYQWHQGPAVPVVSRNDELVY